MFVYAKSLNVIRQGSNDEPEGKTRIGLTAEADDLTIKDLYPLTDRKVMIVAERKRDQLTVKSKESNDDTISQRSTMTAFSRHEPTKIANRFFKQVISIGKIGAMNFQINDLEEE